MTPIESRNSNNTNRVRCFNKEALVPSVADKKWTLVKIICTQPFNKHIQYGLSFIKVHIAKSRPSTSAASEGSTINKKTELPESDKSISLHIGKFKLREDSPDSENDGACSLFSLWKNRKDDKVEETPTPAASIRKANIESICHNRSVVEKPKRNLSTENKQTEVRDRNRNDLLFGDDSVVESEREVRLAKEIEADKERRRLELQKREEAKQKDKRKSVDKNSQRRHNDKENDTNKVKTALNLSAQSTSKNDNSFSEKSKREITKKRPNSPNERPSKKPRGTDIKLRPFNQLLKGVVLVISGIQNPDRANLRTKAIALGAIYKADWDTTCTHLMYVFNL